jgi:hypothetical protein
LNYLFSFSFGFKRKILIGKCNELIPKMTCQGRKLFAGRIRWELGCMTQLLLYASAIARANKRQYFISLTQQHFQVVCGFLKCCCDLKFLPVQVYETFVAQLLPIKKQIKN